MTLGAAITARGLTHVVEGNKEKNNAADPRPEGRGFTLLSIRDSVNLVNSLGIVPTTEENERYLIEYPYNTVNGKSP